MTPESFARFRNPESRVGIHETRDLTQFAKLRCGASVPAAGISELRFTAMRAAFQAAEGSGFSGKSGNRPMAVACRQIIPQRDRPYAPPQNDPNIFLNQADLQSIISPYRSAYFAGLFVAFEDNKSSEPKGLFRKERKSARGGSLCVNAGRKSGVNQNDQPGSHRN